MKSKIFYNGDIITMEDGIETESLLVEDGIIKALGSKDDILKLKKENTELIDLKGKTLLPAFIDSHSHIISFASSLGIVNLSEAKSFKEITDMLREYKEKRKLKKDQWILGFGYDHNFLKEKRHPDKKNLDEASMDNPILIAHASGHMGIVNSLALEKLNITAKSKNPEGGYIGRIEGSDEPNGYLEENAFIKNTAAAPQPTLEDLLRFLDEAQGIYFKYGITTAQEGLIRDMEMAVLKEASKRRKLILDIVGYVDLKNNKKLLENNKEYLNKYINGFKIGGYKIFLDGSPQGRTAWMSEPYEEAEDGYRGYPIYEDKEVQSFVNTALKEDLQLLTHCNGDAAAEQLINSFQGAEIKNKNLRPVMIHAQTVREDQLERMAEINMLPSFFAAHIYYWGDIHIKNFGRKRGYRISPVKTAIEKGVVYTLHQDSPVIMPNMIETLWCVVNRITKGGVEIGVEEKITPYEALKGVTINAAYEYFEEDKKGSIKEGKVADLVILDSNPLKVHPMDIRDIEVVETIKNGETVYRK